VSKIWDKGKGKESKGKAKEKGGRGCDEGKEVLNEFTLTSLSSFSTKI
jgi:hypothetical protein